MAHFVVAGAGIAGLAAAVTLARSGHRIELFERRAALELAGAGLQLSPNATRIVDDIGLLPALEQISVEPRAVRIRRGRDGADVASIPLGVAVRQRFGAPTLLVHRADLHRLLAEAAAASPTVALTFGATVIGTDPAEGGATLSGPHGVRSVHADGLLRADGVHANGHGKNAGPIYSGKTAWRTLIDGAALPALFRASETNLWLGERLHLVHYPLLRGDLVNVVIVVDEPRPTERDGADPWAEPGEPQFLRARMRDWNAVPRLLIENASMWRKWPLFERGPARPWSSGRQTLVGDAAHPMLPFLAQGASQAFEDAAALAEAVAVSPGDIPGAFRAYERSRAARIRRVQDASRRQGQIYHLAGAPAAARDLVMGALGPSRLLARMDWLYASRAPKGPS